MTIQWFYKLRGNCAPHSCENITLPPSTLIGFCRSNIADSDHFDKDVYIINNVVYISLRWQ